ncbi:MAG: alpha/beta fold hydrolase [Dehalococcoidia bacterium]
MTETRVTFPCGDLSLEGVSSVPEAKGPLAAVVVCHPHPLYGGMMDNNVVIAICRAVSQTSIASLRFNFRGVGRSQGEHAEGVGEQDDVAAALSFLASMEGVDQDRIGLCGYSFGAGIALEVAARNEKVKALALVSPMLSHPSPIESYVKPKLLLWGSQDLALPAADLKSFTEGLPEPKEYEVIPGADHFWRGYEDKLAPRVAAFFTEILKPSAQA